MRFEIKEYKNGSDVTIYESKNPLTYTVQIGVEVQGKFEKREEAEKLAQKLLTGYGSVPTCNFLKANNHRIFFEYLENSVKISVIIDYEVYDQLDDFLTEDYNLEVSYLLSNNEENHWSFIFENPSESDLKKFKTIEKLINS